MTTSDPPLLRLVRDGSPLAYTDEGPPDAPAVLAVHGVPGSVRDFRYLGPQLDGSLRLVRVDLPGFGGSRPAPAQRPTFARRAEAVLAVADHLSLERFAVLGHSMGGGTALCVGAREPRRVALVALAASIGLRRHRGLTLPPRLFGWLALGLRVRGLRTGLAALARAAYRRLGFSGSEALGPEDFAHQFRALAATDFAAIRRFAAGALPPVLVAFAEDDPLVEAAIPRELSASLPTATLVPFRDGGHHIQKTRAPELAAALRATLLA